MMNNRPFRIALTISFVAALQACAGVRLPFPGEVTTQVESMSVSYVPRQTGLDRWVNAQPVDLSTHKTQTEKAMALFGYPKLSWYPEGRLTYASTTKVAIIETPLYMRSTYGGPGDLKPQSRGSASTSDSVITAGLGSGNGGLAAAGALASIGSSGQDADPRTNFSHMLCYKAQAQFDATAALQSCWKDWLGQMRSMPAREAELHHLDFVQFGLSVPTQAGGKGHVRMTLNRSRAEYFEGSAPVQMGGFKAHIFHLYPIVRALPGDQFTVEDLVAELAKKKPADVIYLIAGNSDSRERAGVDPVGLVD